MLIVAPSRHRNAKPTTPPCAPSRRAEWLPATMSEPPRRIPARGHRAGGFNDRFGDVFGNIYAFTSNIYAFTSDGLTQRQPSRAAGKKLQRGPGSLRLQPEEACQTPVESLAGHP